MTGDVAAAGHALLGARRARTAAVSALAEAAGLPLSSHIFPEFSAHLLVVTPTCHWLEYLDVASAVLQQPVQVKDGHVLVPEVPGAGLEWDEEAVRRFAAS
jgi:mandelate racemase